MRGDISVFCGDISVFCGEYEKPNQDVLSFFSSLRRGLAVHIQLTLFLPRKHILQDLKQILILHILVSTCKIALQYKKISIK